MAGRMVRRADGRYQYALTITDEDGSRKRIYFYGSTHFDDSEHVWTIGAAPNAFDIETIALHELGRIVGLAHSSVPGAVMLPSVSPNFTKRALTQDDIDGFRRLIRCPPALSGWHSQGGVLTSEIAVASNADGRLEVFARAPTTRCGTSGRHSRC